MELPKEFEEVLAALQKEAEEEAKVVQQLMETVAELLRQADKALLARGLVLKSDPSFQRVVEAALKNIGEQAVTTSNVSTRLVFKKMIGKKPPEYCKVSNYWVVVGIKTKETITNSGTEKYWEVVISYKVSPEFRTSQTIDKKKSSKK